MRILCFVPLFHTCGGAKSRNADNSLPRRKVKVFLDEPMRFRSACRWPNKYGNSHAVRVDPL